MLADGNELIQRGDGAGALCVFQELKSLGQAMRHPGILGKALTSLGTAYELLGQYEQAIAQYNEAFEISYGVDDQRSVGRLRCNVGHVFHQLGQYARATEQCTAALTISRRTGDRQSELNALGCLGNTYSSLGQEERAMEHFTLALAIARNIGDRYSEGNCLGSLGRMHYDLGQCERAIQLHNGALTISRALGDRRGECSSLGSLGSAYESLEQYDRALEQHTAMLVIAREIGDRRHESDALQGLGIASCKLGQVTGAIENLAEALSISREIGDLEGEGIALCSLASAYSKLEQPRAAIEHLTAAQAAFDAIWATLSTDEQRISLDDTDLHAVTARKLQVGHMQLGQHEAALEAAERARSRAFERLLVLQRMQPNTQAGAASPPRPVRQAPINDAPISCAELRSLASRQRAALVIYSQITPTMILVWVVKSEPPGAAIVFRELPIPEHEKSLTQLVELTRRKLRVCARDASKRDRGVKNLAGSLFAGQKEALPEPAIDTQRLEVQLDQMSEEALLRRCHELLIAPLDDALRTEQRLIIVPDRDLYALPFAALRDSSGKHLIAKHVLSVAPSAGTLIELEQSIAARTARDAGVDDGHPTALVVGDPFFQGWAKQLPGARAEADEVAMALSAKHETTLLSHDWYVHRSPNLPSVLHVALLHSPS